MKLKVLVEGDTIRVIPTKRVRAAIANEGVVTYTIVGQISADADDGYEASVELAAVSEAI